VNRTETGRHTASTKRSAQGAVMFSEQAWSEIGKSLSLSGRELQIVRGVFDDLTEHAIAADLHISPHTVHSHIDRLHRKLGVVDRVGLALRIMQEFVALTLKPGSLLPSICPNRAAGKCPLLNRKRLPS
jgi:DNA-binding NarL/FixJ family response regulator